MRKLIVYIFLLWSFNVHASTILTPTVYQNGGSVTAANLNGNFTAVNQVVNGGLDNTNANTTQGYRFYQTVAVLPSPGNQGSVYFLTSDNSLNFDTGTSFSKSISVISPSANQVPIYNGSSWIPTSITNLGFTAGMIIEWSGTIATIPSGWVLCNGSNGTPDLRNKFIVAADADSGGVAKTTLINGATQSGGSTTIDITQMPAHTHNVIGGNSGNVPGGPVLFDATNSAGTPQATSSAGGGQPYAQPYYALAYIMKT